MYLFLMRGTPAASIVQEPVRKLKAETIDKALQQIRKACDVLESDSNIELIFRTSEGL